MGMIILIVVVGYLLAGLITNCLYSYMNGFDATKAYDQDQAALDWINS